MWKVSALADSGLLLPAWAGLLVYLAWSRDWALLRAFACAVALVGAATLVAKLVFRACGPAITDLDVMSPSGHASLATVFYGTLAIALATGRPAAVRLLLVGAAALLVAAVAVSRVALRLHSVEEVIFGLGIGLLCVLVFDRVHSRLGRPSLSFMPLTIGLVVALAAFGGRSFTPERYIIDLARQSAAYLDVCTADPSRSAAFPTR